jgi:signal peptidase I
MHKYKPYLAAAILAFLMTVLIAPEMHEGNAMSPDLESGDVIVLLKGTYSENRGMPEIGELVVLDKGAFGEDYEEDSPMRIVSGLPGDQVEMEDGTLVTVDKNKVFVTCKEEGKGIDSRNMEIGPIDGKTIRGKVILRIWPFDRLGGVTE